MQQPEKGQNEGSARREGDRAAGTAAVPCRTQHPIVLAHCERWELRTKEIVIVMCMACPSFLPLQKTLMAQRRRELLGLQLDPHIYQNDYELDDSANDKSEPAPTENQEENVEMMCPSARDPVIEGCPPENGEVLQHTCLHMAIEITSRFMFPFVYIAGGNLLDCVRTCRRSIEKQMERCRELIVNDNMKQNDESELACNEEFRVDEIGNFG